MAGILSTSPFQILIQFPQLDPKLPQLLAEVRNGSNSGEQLLSIHVSSMESEGTTESFVQVLSIHLSDLRFTVNRQISAQLQRGSSSPVSPPPLLCIEFFVSLSPVQRRPAPPLPPAQTPVADPAPSPLRGPLPPPLPCHGERRGGGRKEMTILRIGP
jgi:hypothetical protein